MIVHKNCIKQAKYDCFFDNVDFQTKPPVSWGVCRIPIWIYFVGWIA
jgi:hypothetical protein